MSKNSVADWSQTPDANTDIAGIDIGENCPAQGINNAIRTLMAQFATFIANAAFTSLSVTTLTVSGTASFIGGLALAASSTVKDLYGTARAIGYRNVPSISKTSAYTLMANDVGECVDITTGGVTIPANVFARGDVVAIANESDSAQAITQGSGLTLIQAGAASANAGNRSLAANGLATVRFRSATVAVITGSGLL